MLGVSLGASAQMARSGYMMTSNPLMHEMNPAFQPDRAYISLPLIGGMGVSWRSSMAMDDILFDTPSGKLTTFMSRGTISKSDLMDRVGDGFSTTADARITLFSMGKRKGPIRYQTWDISWRNTADAYVPADVFRCLKDVENGTFDFSRTGISLSSVLAVSMGQSFRFTPIVSIGFKANVLLGIMHADLETENLQVQLTDDRWTAQGDVTANVSGLRYKTGVHDYKGRPGSYEAINGFSVGGLGLNGAGLSLDAGVIVKPLPGLSISASVLDLGFVSWFRSQHASNSGQPFEFSGLHNATIDSDDENSAQKQVDRLGDDLMDMINLQDKGRQNNLRMLGATVNAGVQWKGFLFRAGAVVTARVSQQYSWVEGRLQGGIKPCPWFSAMLSPSYSRYGLALGAMADFSITSGTHITLSSDRLAIYRLNRQYIPKSLSADVQLGVTLGL